MKYNIDKEKGKLVAVPEMEKPDIMQMAIPNASEIVSVRLFNEAMEKYEDHLKTLPPPITYSPEFFAYSETTPGPYERDVHFETKLEHKQVQYSNEEWSRSYEEIEVAYPIQKAEPESIPELKKREVDFWKKLKKEHANWYFRQKPYFPTPDQSIDWLQQYFKTQPAAEPAPLPDNWNESKNQTL